MGGKPKQDKAALAENEARQKEIEAQNLANERKMREYEYTSLMNDATRKARMEAEQGVTAERTQGMKDSSKLLTDYQAQERRRLFEAKKGTGQVGAEDMAITQDMVKEARGLLDRGSDYWDAKRSVAGDTAYQGAMDKFLKEQGTKDKYVAGGSLFQTAQKTAARTAQAKKDPTYGMTMAQKYDYLDSQRGNQ